AIRVCLRKTASQCDGAETRLMAHELRNVGTRARRRIALRLLPFVFVMYVICYIDRANVSFANLRMSADLGFSDRVYGLGVGIFFLGYVLFEIPGAIIVERWECAKMACAHHDHVGTGDDLLRFRSDIEAVLCRSSAGWAYRG